MKKEKLYIFLKKGFLFAFIVIAVDFSFGLILDKLYSNSKSGVAFQENQVFFKTKDSILIFGSSRAAFHYKPEIIAEKTGLTCYNDGREGMGIYFHYAALLATLERYKPKTVILDLDFRDVYDRGGSFGEDVFSDLAPFYGKINAEFDNYICRNWYDHLLYHSNLIRYNKKVFNIITGNVIKTTDNKKGYIPLKGQWNGKDKVLKKDEFNIEPKLIKTINQFIAKAHSKDIEVILVFSPTFKRIKPEFFNIINRIANENKVRLLNYYNAKEFKNHRILFHDSEHLNDNGASIFSNEIARNIKF